MSFSNKNQFSECSAVTCLDVWVRVSEDDAKVNFSIYSQAKRPQCSQTVTCTAWVPASTGQTQKANVGLQKTSTKEIERPSFFFFFCCCWVILFLFVCVCRERGISDLCAVTWLDCDRHLKRWHSAGPIATAAHDELERCKHGLWSVEPPLSANTRWSTEPPWIL